MKLSLSAGCWCNGNAVCAKKKAEKEKQISSPVFDSITPKHQRYGYHNNLSRTYKNIIHWGRFNGTVELISGSQKKETVYIYIYNIKN